MTKFDTKFLLIESSEIRCTCEERLPDLVVYLPDPFDVDQSSFAFTSREGNEENRVDEETKCGRFVSVRDSRVLEDVDESCKDSTFEGDIRAEGDVSIEEAGENGVIGRGRIGVGIDDME